MYMYFFPDCKYKALHEPSGELSTVLQLPVGGTACIFLLLIASSTLWPHCSNIYNACKGEERNHWYEVLSTLHYIWESTWQNLLTLRSSQTYISWHWAHALTPANSTQWPFGGRVWKLDQKWTRTALILRHIALKDRNKWSLPSFNSISW